MSRFEAFTRIDVPYRTVNEAPLETTILIPTELFNLDTESTAVQKYPVMVRWHGGGFITGHRMYGPWFAQWLLELALSRNAIIVSPDYRLLPESNGVDLLSDITAFWKWLQTELPILADQKDLPRPDLTRILCCGESSGGLLAVYCALHLSSFIDISGSSNGNAVRITALLSISAPLDTSDSDFTVPRPRTILGITPPPPRQALAKIRNYIKKMPPGKVRTASEPTPDIWELLLCVVQQAYLPRLLNLQGNMNMLSLMQTLEDEPVKADVPIWVIHGANDTLVHPCVLRGACTTG